MEGPVKIVSQPEPHDLGRTDGNIRIAGKIAIDLNAEEEGSCNQRHSGILSGIVINLVDDNAQLIGDDHFLKESPDHQF